MTLWYTSYMPVFSPTIPPGSRTATFLFLITLIGFQGSPRNAFIKLNVLSINPNGQQSDWGKIKSIVLRVVKHSLCISSTGQVKKSHPVLLRIVPHIPVLFDKASSRFATYNRICFFIDALYSFIHSLLW